MSRTAGYAVQAVVYIAMRPSESPVSAAQLAARLAVPEKYLGRVLNTLAHRGTLTSARGARGGFRLAGPAAALTLAEIVEPFDPVGRPPQCLLRHVRCGADSERCAAHDGWHDVANTVREYFHKTTVGDLVGANTTTASVGAIA